MGKLLQFPVIAGVEITTDLEGRFNLNALHRASSEGAEKAPAKWFRNKQTKALISELEKQTGQICTVTSEGRNGGSFAHELLAVSYAGWINPAFQLKVNQVFIDYRTGTIRPAIPQTMPEALRLAAELAEAVEEMKPKAKALDRIATSDGAMCITDAAKDLQIKRKDLILRLSNHKWIYRRGGKSSWIGYQDKVQCGYLEHKVSTIERPDGTEKSVSQVRITPKGLTKLAQEVAA